jgi:hypothetical protein
MGKSVPRHYDNWQTVEGIMKWLAERGIVPCWDHKRGKAYFTKDTPKSATQQFIQVLRLFSQEQVERRRLQLEARPDWQALRAF